MKTVVYVVLGMLLVFVLVMTALTFSTAEEAYEGYVLCMGDTFVNIREKPSTRSQCLGRYDVGDSVLLDGREKNGFLHCVNLPLEETEGWIYKGYVVLDKPEYIGGNATIVSRGRLAARKCVDGKRTRWLKSGATLKVWYWSEEWCLTNCGYVKSMYLELDGE